MVALSYIGDSATAETEALSRLGDNFGSLLPSSRFADACIAVGQRKVAVHRCVLAARSPFFLDELDKREREGRHARLELGELLEDFKVGYEALMFVLGYLYSGRVGLLPSGVCECVDEKCNHEACWPALDFMAQVLYASFVFRIPELYSVFQRRLLHILDNVAIDDMPVILKVANLCSSSCTQLEDKCTQIVVNSDLDMVTIEKELPPLVVQQIKEMRSGLGLDGPEKTSFPDKHAEKICRALESDDIELVNMLLKEGHGTLDKAYGLHYAVKYCDLKIVTTILDLDIADVNHKNLRGYNVLHIASMRKQPKIILSLLNKGARATELASDGRRALEISKRLTRSVDYDRFNTELKSPSDDQLCIQILERAESRDPLTGQDFIYPAMDGHYLRQMLLYLENRVHLARIIFPKEAKLAMDIAETDRTFEFQISMDLCETPEKHCLRMSALWKTVELGKFYFPECSEYLNTIVDDDILVPETSEGQKRRFKEIQDELFRIFNAEKRRKVHTKISK